MTHFEWLIIIKSSDFLEFLKNNKNILKNIKFHSQLDFHMKNILTGHINYLNFEDRETVRITQVIRAMRSTVAKLNKKWITQIYQYQTQKREVTIYLGSLIFQKI
jgi:uncharacterized protein YjaZ